MNKYQKIAITITGVYLPWKMVLEDAGSAGQIKIERFWKYSYFFKPPDLPSDKQDVQKFDYFIGSDVLYSLYAIDLYICPKSSNLFVSDISSKRDWIITGFCFSGFLSFLLLLASLWYSRISNVILDFRSPESSRVLLLGFEKIGKEAALQKAGFEFRRV